MQDEKGFDALRRVALERLTWARGFTHAMLADLTDDQLLARAGGRGNHPLWVMGHLAQTDDSLLSALTGEPPKLPAPYKALFGGNREPTATAADYPGRDELKAAMHASRERVVAWVRSLDENTAYAPTPDFLRRFAPDRITAAFAMAAHEMLHNGQVASVRSALGLPRLLR
jgi:uncharacterized damage-inducible protein DinB